MLIIRNFSDESTFHKCQLNMLNESIKSALTAYRYPLDPASKALIINSHPI